MSVPIESRLRLLQDSVERIAHERYGIDHDPTLVTRLALDANDCSYFLARLQLAEALHQAAAQDLHWMAPGQPIAARESLARIKAICHYFPGLYEAMMTAQSTHQSVTKAALAQALKQFRPDLEPYSTADVAGMLTAAWVGGREGLDAVFRTRKSSARRASLLPW